MEFFNISAARGADGVYRYAETESQRYIQYGGKSSLSMGLIMTDDPPIVTLEQKRHKVNVPFTNGTRDLSSFESNVVFEYSLMKYTFIAVIDRYDTNGRKRSVNDMSVSCNKLTGDVNDWLCTSGENYKGKTLTDTGLTFYDCCCSDIKAEKTVYSDAWTVTFDVTFHCIPSVTRGSSSVYSGEEVPSGSRYISFGSLRTDTAGLIMTDKTALWSKKPKLSFINVRSMNGGINTSFREPDSGFYFGDKEIKYSFVRLMKKGGSVRKMTNRAADIINYIASMVFIPAGSASQAGRSGEIVFGGNILRDSAESFPYIGARCDKLEAFAEFSDEYWILHFELRFSMYPFKGGQV